MRAWTALAVFLCWSNWSISCMIDGAESGSGSIERKTLLYGLCVGD